MSTAYAAVHIDAWADTGDGYEINRSAPDWHIRCLWCDWEDYGRLKRDAVSKYRTHESLVRATESFNLDNPLGTRVRYWTGAKDGNGRHGYIWHHATVLGHTAVAWIRVEGTDQNVGAVALTHVEPIRQGGPA
jgi:hypothetical protein